jgi:hypothetical protein
MPEKVADEWLVRCAGQFAVGKAAAELPAATGDACHLGRGDNHVALIMRGWVSG